MTQETSRPIVASWYRKGRLITVRHYVRLDTSIPTITRNLILDGQPGDVVEFAHNVTGMWIGTMKLRLRNGAAYLESSWVWDN